MLTTCLGMCFIITRWTRISESLMQMPFLDGMSWVLPLDGLACDSLCEKENSKYPSYLQTYFLTTSRVRS